MQSISIRAAVISALAVSAFAACPAIAQEGKGALLDPAKAGVAVYPGAKPDAGSGEFVRQSLHLTAATYRTNDDVAKVAEFYAKQSGVQKMPGATNEQAGFSAGCKDEYNPYMKKNMAKCGYHVTIQKPWMDMKTGKLVQDTLITIAKQ